MTLIVNNVNIIPYVKYQGFKWQYSAIDSETAGRTMDGLMHRDIIGDKRRLDIECLPLTLENASIVLTAILPEYFPVTYTDPQAGTDVTKMMYTNNYPASFSFIKDGKEYWGGISFPLIEQ